MSMAAQTIDTLTDRSDDSFANLRCAQRRAVDTLSVIQSVTLHWNQGCLGNERASLRRLATAHERMLSV